MTTYRIDLPYDRPPLSLNARMGWAQRYRIEKSLRDAVYIQARNKRVRAERLTVALHWRPAVKRERDLDNAYPTLKPCIDALVRAVDGQPLGARTARDGHERVTPDVVIHPVEKGAKAELWIEVEAL